MHKFSATLISIMLAGMTNLAISQEKKLTEPGGGIGGTGHTTATTPNKNPIINMRTTFQMECEEDQPEIAKVIFTKNNSLQGSVCLGSEIETTKNDYLVLGMANNQTITISGQGTFSFSKEIELKLEKYLPLLKIDSGKIRFQNKDKSNNFIIESHSSIIEIVGSDVELNINDDSATKTQQVAVRPYKGSAWIHIENESLFVEQGYIGKLNIHPDQKIFSTKKDIGQAGGRIPVKID